MSLVKLPQMQVSLTFSLEVWEVWKRQLSFAQTLMSRNWSEPLRSSHRTQSLGQQDLQLLTWLDLPLTWTTGNYCTKCRCIVKGPAQQSSILSCFCGWFFYLAGPTWMTLDVEGPRWFKKSLEKQANCSFFFPFGFSLVCFAEGLPPQVSPLGALIASSNPHVDINLLNL